MNHKRAKIAWTASAVGPCVFMLAACALLCAGCGIIVITDGKAPAARGAACHSKGPCYGGETVASAAMPANWSGEACDEVLFNAEESYRQSSWSSPPETDRRKQVLLATCARYRVRYDNHTGYPRMIDQHARIARPDIEQVHGSFDDRQFDHVTAALLVWSCTQTPLCYSQGTEEHYGIGVPTDREAVLGIVGLYALHTDFAALERQLGELNLPEGVAPAFLAVAHDANTKVVEDLAALSDDVRPTLVEIPRTVFTERQAYFSAHAAIYKKLDDLLARSGAARQSGTAEPGLVIELLTLRSGYMNVCGARACQLDPFYEEVTEEIVLVQAALGNGFAVRAEQETYRTNGQPIPGLAQMIYLRQQPLALAGRDAFERLKKAREEGVDEATARTLLGGVAPVRYTHTSLVRPEMQWPDYAKVLDHKWEPPLSGYVGAVKTKGDDAVIRFKATKHQVDVPYNCRSSGRLERIHSDGRLEYEETCSWKKKTETSPGPDPVTVPASEAGSIKPGDLVSVAVGPGRRGIVRVVYRGDDIVQVGDDAVKPEPIPKKKR